MIDEPCPPIYDTQDLEENASRGCTTPGCNCSDGTVYFRSVCCGAPPSVSYTRGTGAVILECSECGEIMFAIATKDRPELAVNLG